MGYDVSLRIDTGKEMTKIDEPRFTLSYGYHLVLTELFDVLHPTELDGKLASELEPMVDRALNKLINCQSDKYEKMISYKNGLSVDELVDWLSQLLVCCQDHPKCIVFIY